MDACWLPVLGPEEKRILDMRRRLDALRGLLGPEAVLKMHGATFNDLDMLAALEEEARPEENGEDA